MSPQDQTAQERQLLTFTLVTPDKGCNNPLPPPCPLSMPQWSPEDQFTSLKGFHHLLGLERALLKLLSPAAT